MTEISDAEVAEVQWASSKEGKAAHRAAWERARELGLDKRLGETPGMDRADVGAIVWAAHRAAEAERAEADEPEPAGCAHAWVVTGAQEVPPQLVMLGKPVPRTAVLAGCERCGQPVSWILDGAWTLDDLR